MNQDEIYDMAVELYEEERFSEAIDLLDLGYKKNPKDADLILLLADCYNQIHKFTQATKLLLEANKIEPNNPYITYNLGYSLICMGRFSDGMRYLKKCLRLRPPRKIKRMAKKLINAEEELKEKCDDISISIDEDFACADKFLKAQQYLYSKKFEKAILLYKEILSKKPNHSPSIQNIGLCYLNRGELRKAIPYFEKADRQDSSDFLSLANLAYTYYLLRDTKRSEDYSKKVMEKIKNLILSPTLRDAVRAICIFIEIGKFSLARKLIHSCDNHLRNKQLIFLSGVIYANQKNYPAALREFNSIRDESEIAEEYFRKTKEIISGKIKDYNFKAEIIEWNIEMV